MKITREQMLEIVPDYTLVTRFLHYINTYSEIFEINTPLRMTHFLAQCLHESNGLKNLKELGKASYFTKYEKGKLGMQLGNIYKGDGAKYRGRGLIQITGRANYKAYQNSGYCTGDIMDKPELLEQPLGATKSAMWWWMKHRLNSLADKDDILKITKKINGGTNGLEDRKKWFTICEKVLCV